VRKTVARFADGDVANELLRDFRFDSSVLCRSVMAAPWGFGVAGRDAGSFHMVLEGQGWLEVEGGTEPVHLRAGDLAVLPTGSAHWVKDSPATTAPSLTSILARHGVVDGELRFGGDGGPLTEIVRSPRSPGGSGTVRRRRSAGPSSSGSAAPRASSADGPACLAPSTTAEAQAPGSIRCLVAGRRTSGRLGHGQDGRAGEVPL
jgi:hypothetical protein